MRRSVSLIAAIASLTPALATCQIPRDNPLVDASHAIGVTGLGTAALGDKTRSTFASDGTRTFAKEFARKLGRDAADAAQIEKGILTVMDAYEKGVRKAGMANDIATALAFSVDELYAYDRGEEIDKDAFMALVPRFRAVLAKVDATDVQKQRYYEYVLACAGSVMTLGATATDDAAKTRAKNVAEILLEALVGAKPNAIFLEGPNVEIRALTSKPAEAAQEAPVAQGGNVVGEWRWISTGSVTNWNTATGAYAGAGRGMTKRYVFNPDGTFKQDALIQVNNSGHSSSAYITAEGRYEIHGDTIRFFAVRGHLHGEDGMISSGNYDRPMPEETVRNVISATYRYDVKWVDGKLAFVLHLGKEAKDDMIFFAPARK